MRSAHHRQLLGRIRESRTPCLLLSPDLTIVEASDAYLRATLTFRDEIRGEGMFKVFPDNPNEELPDGVHNLGSSLARVCKTGEPDVMAVQRYDVRDHVSRDGAWIEKYWAPANSPILHPGSREIAFIVHEVQDVSAIVRARRSMMEQLSVTAEQQASLRRMQADLARQRQELAFELGRIEHSLARDRQRGALAGSGLGSSAQPRPADAGIYFAPGDHAPVMGVYRTFHRTGCKEASSTRFFRRDEHLPVCRRCHADVRWRLIKTYSPS